MHENREISCTSWLQDQDRSAKAKNRTADTHVREKSDCAVLPVNQPNKEGQPFAEVGGGRAQIEENIVRSRMSQGLRGVRKAATERKQDRFTALLHHLTISLLRDSFYALQRRAAPGVDGVTWREYEIGLEDRLLDLHNRVHRRAYRAQPSRRVYIPKADGRQRPLGIAALEDKLVQQAVVTILNQIYGVDFKGFSYGFRPGRSPHQALDALNVGIFRKRVNWVLDADIRGFFDNMSHEWTMKFIEHRVTDRRMLGLIQKWMKAGVSEDGQWAETSVGTPQGAVVTPLTQKVTFSSNAYGNEFSCGMFTGYTLDELERVGYFTFENGADKLSTWHMIRAHLDFAVMGRYNANAPSNLPLRTSRNQGLHLFSSRYRESDFGEQMLEISLGESGAATVTGFPVLGQLA
jgi:RNA-directed DNA polymerase